MKKKAEKPLTNKEDRQKHYFYCYKCETYRFFERSPMGIYHCPICGSAVR